MLYRYLEDQGGLQELLEGQYGCRRAGREWLCMYLEKGPLQEHLGGWQEGHQGMAVQLPLQAGGPDRAGGGFREELKVLRGREWPLKYFH